MYVLKLPYDLLQCQITQDEESQKKRKLNGKLKISDSNDDEPLTQENEIEVS